ncbi:biopolymer transporter ExbD [Pseudoalteromonas sp. SG43-7]|mgnify:CR=1 FL=1|jgi:biopolymer transport protein ExbD|uniref:ExbD/TolR family protein n=1 Tax=Pseudoalteromonas rhizosphaerae TaxID=2518973 RepID=A0ABW8KSX5_9GAMM|nr:MULTISPECIES: biopolymer transporter ExbD [Pseudoalteromonas]MBB1293895.1 biopolymer transporter ExbD [Pseudoalteromonas sp. SR41-4]MBB1334750.1 biopolymer transporter ExbD [Pseudoalteromonas sp. SR41-6]MBB1343700.1 biopolymer transporter ExbD [Pseudoalteromonas sp. SR45-6]MBB1399513.1 biopolymer transporter ExbD [Pseudoalteromonas sp. SG44-8]MBB1419324.1 biopolymer transporter ExbD [Pseudoalteromonas sp. SG44-1]
MQARLKQRLEQQSAHHIDMSPLLDVVFILLIFFIVTTVFVRESGVEVDKPQAVSASRLEQQVIFLAITDSQQVYFDGSQIGVAGVRSSVEQMLKQQQRPVVIQADKTVPTELLVKVIDEAKLAGAATVNLATQQ